VFTDSFTSTENTYKKEFRILMERKEAMSVVGWINVLLKAFFKL
jgi:hypothetical protein